MIYCKYCGFSLVDFEIEEMCEKDSEAICWECTKKNKNEETQHIIRSEAN